MRGLGAFCFCMDYKSKRWLRLRNAVRVPALQAVSGRVTVQEVAIMPLPPEPMPPPAPASFP